MNNFLPKDDLYFKEVFSKISNENFSDYIKKISRLIYTNELGNDSVEKVLNEHNIIQLEDIKEEILDLMLAYINIVLDNNIITENEARNVKLLKKFFKVKEGDFYNYRHKQIESILNKQFERIYADNQIDTEEALHKVGLQELFDLSYDQFLNLIDKEVKAALQRGADPNELDTVIIEIYQNKKQSSQG